MAIRIKSRHGETINQMLRRFKKLCEKEGLTKEIKRRQYYEKPSERARRDARRSFARTLRPDMDRSGGGMRPSGPRTGPRSGPRGSSGPRSGGQRSGGGRSGGPRPGGPRGRGPASR
jgi:small subunit ribosomal protein S21